LSLFSQLTDVGLFYSIHSLWLISSRELNNFKGYPWGVAGAVRETHFERILRHNDLRREIRFIHEIRFTLVGAGFLWDAQEWRVIIVYGFANRLGGLFHVERT